MFGRQQREKNNSGRRRSDTKAYTQLRHIDGCVHVLLGKGRQGKRGERGVSLQCSMPPSLRSSVILFDVLAQ